MAEKSPIFNEEFWKLLSYLDQVNGERALGDIEKDLGFVIGQNGIIEVINFFRHFGHEYQLKAINGSLFVSAPASRESIHMEFSLSEWISLQAHFPVMQQLNDFELHKTIAEKFGKVERRFPELDLYRVLESGESREQVLNKVSQKDYQVIAQIEAAIARRLTLDFKFKDNRNFEIFPHRLVFMEGDLSIVGEDASDRCLVSFAVDEIEGAELVEAGQEYRHNFSSLEIDDFIYAIRSMNGNEERLVLKVNAGENVDLTPQYHFLGNPYVTSNMDGDIIWAASIEVTDEVFEWLYSIKDHVDVLDPQEIRDDFHDYCKAVDHKNNLKKAS